MTNDHITTVDQAVAAAERRWGVGRLRLLVSETTRTRFDRADQMWNQAIAAERAGDFPAKPIPDLAAMMLRAWAAMDAEATAAGCQHIGPAAFEHATASGTVLVVCPTRADATAYVQAAHAAGRAVLVWTMEEVAALIGPQQLLASVKQHFPGAMVRTARIRSDGDEAIQAVYEDGGDDPATYTAPGPSRPAYDHAKARAGRSRGLG